VSIMKRDRQVKKLHKLFAKMGELLKQLTPDDMARSDIAVEVDERPGTFVALDLLEDRVVHDGDEYCIEVRWSYSLFNPDDFNPPPDRRD
jgi:hypothetical protein